MSTLKILLQRSIEQWRGCDPARMATQSPAAVTWGFMDAKADILQLVAQRDELLRVLENLVRSCVDEFVEGPELDAAEALLNGYAKAAASLGPAATPVRNPTDWPEETVPGMTVADLQKTGAIDGPVNNR